MEDLTKPSDNASSTIRFLINEFDEELKSMSGKCLDVGCAHGEHTKNIILPALDSKAVIIGKQLQIANM